MSRNFEVGDIVINLNKFQFWDNVFHFEKALNSIKHEVVTAADDEYFSTMLTGEDPFSGLWTGNDDNVRYNTYLQKNGICYDADYVFTDRYYNLTRNTEAVLQLVNEAFTKRFEDCTKSEQDEIASLEQEVLVLQARIQLIEKGKRRSRVKPEIVEREFLERNRTAILKAINGE